MARDEREAFVRELWLPSRNEYAHPGAVLRVMNYLCFVNSKVVARQSRALSGDLGPSRAISGTLGHSRVISGPLGSGVGAARPARARLAQAGARAH